MEKSKIQTRVGLKVNISAPRGTKLTCKSRQTEAALRMLMNNLDREVAEKPDELIVYGGAGKAARNWESYLKIVECLMSLEDDERFLIQSGKPVGIFRTHTLGPHREGIQRYGGQGGAKSPHRDRSGPSGCRLRRFPLEYLFFTLFVVALRSL